MVGVIITPGVVPLIRNDYHAYMVEMVTLSWVSLVSGDQSHHLVPGSSGPRSSNWIFSGPVEMVARREPNSHELNSQQTDV